MVNSKVVVQFIKFGLVGAFCLAVDMAITFTLKELFGIDKYISNSIGFIISSTVNFYLHRKWTFGSSNKALKEYYIFIIIATAGLLLNSFTLFVLTDYLDLNLSAILPMEELSTLLPGKDEKFYNFYIAKLIAVALVFFWNFGMNRKFTFKPTILAENA